MRLTDTDARALSSAGLRLDHRAIYSGSTPVARVSGDGGLSTTTVHAVDGRVFLPFSRMGEDGGGVSAIERFCRQFT